MNPCITTHGHPIPAGTECPREIHAHKADGTIVTGVCVTEYLLERNVMWQFRAHPAEAKVEKLKSDAKFHEAVAVGAIEREKSLHAVASDAQAKFGAVAEEARRRHEEAVSISKALDAERTARRRAEGERDEYRDILRSLGRILGPNPKVERIWVRVQRLFDEAKALRERNRKLESELWAARVDAFTANLRASGKATSDAASSVASFANAAVPAFPRAPLATPKMEAEDPRGAIYRRRLTVETLWRRYYAFADAVEELISAGEAAVSTGKDDPARKDSVAQTIIDLAANERNRRRGLFEVPPLPPAPAIGWRVLPKDEPLPGAVVGPAEVPDRPVQRPRAVSATPTAAPSSGGARPSVAWVMATVRAEDGAVMFRARSNRPSLPIVARIAGAMKVAAQREIEIAKGETPVRKAAIERIHKCRLCTFVWDAADPEKHALECPAAPKED